MRRNVLAGILWFMSILPFALPDMGRAAADTDTSSVHVALFLERGLTDEGYTNALIAGLERARRELGIRYRIVVADQDTEEAEFLRTARGDHDLVLVPTSHLHSLLRNNAGNFPKVRFGAIDGVVKAPNVLSADFAEAEAAFLAGAAAAMFTTASGISGVNPDRVIGWVGVTDTWEARNVLTGFMQGARLIDPQVRVEAIFTGARGTPEEGRQAALGLYNQGADVVAGGESVTGQGVLQAAREKGRYAIGLDVDQDGVMPGHVLTSRLKALDTVVFRMVKAVTDGSFKGGETLTMNIANNGVGITDMRAMKQTLGNKFPKEIPERLNDLAYELKRGGIKAGSPPRKGLCRCL